MALRRFLVDCQCGITSASWAHGEHIPDPYIRDGIVHRFDKSECRCIDHPCECGHLETDHRSIPPYHCQHGMGVGPVDCECPTFTEENKERLDAEYDAQRYEDHQEGYR